MLGAAVLAAVLTLAAAADSNANLYVTAFVAVFASLAAPSVLIVVSGRQRRRERQEDWDRQDKLAAKIDVVHTLVNADKTAGIQRELDDAELALEMLHEIATLREQSGQPVNGDASGRTHATQAKITSLKAELAERARATELAEAQIAANPNARVEPR